MGITVEQAEHALEKAYDLAQEAMVDAFESHLSVIAGYVGSAEFEINELLGGFTFLGKEIPEGINFKNFVKQITKIDHDAVVVTGPGDMFDSDEMTGSVYIFSDSESDEEDLDARFEEDDEFEESTINKTVDRLLTEDTDVSDVKIIGNLGDVHPLDYGGFIISESDGRIFGEYWNEPEGEDENAKYTIYRFGIDKDAVSDLSWVKEEDWKSLAEALGESVEEFKAHGKSEDPLERAIIYREVGGYWGFDNLDSYPLELTRAEMEKRWPQFK